MRYESAHTFGPPPADKPTTPTGFARFPRDIVPPPRDWAARWFNVQRWTEMPRRGHFAAFAEPELLAEELRAFFRPFRVAPR